MDCPMKSHEVWEHLSSNMSLKPIRWYTWLRTYIWDDRMNRISYDGPYDLTIGIRRPMTPWRDLNMHQLTVSVQWIAEHLPTTSDGFRN